MMWLTCFKQAKRVITYDVKYLGYNEEKKQVELGGLDGTFSKTVCIFQYMCVCVRVPCCSSCQIDVSRVCA